ncbi:PIG-L family deacetylase, partial [Burkholderia pseudomallei]
VFAGVPPPRTHAPPWDRRAGVARGADAMRARRAEDARALRMLVATPVWLDFLDDQYGAPAAPDDIAQQRAATLDAHPGVAVAAPAGLCH